MIPYGRQSAVKAARSEREFGSAEGRGVAILWSHVRPTAVKCSYCIDSCTMRKAIFDSTLRCNVAHVQRVTFP